ncbi:hypothetical protein Q4E93_18860 [Flavitalea sp. BT771]|uniref:hypothetical protein n=1 Tax=Flavitalea sp. BT771 TaxID=3063329 RepID=UPI0026E315E2|nr:hypothetical protein [Flavitalea sp. BT771]MDO6432674.1 hypothetical protein [Flavitalea sp. BT771]MDV6222050.1 hypothetical protein [Flavitalea sp. BT771]
MAQYQWTAQQQAIGSDGVPFGIQSSPAVVATGNQVFMFWNGGGGDGIYYSIFDLSQLKWTPQQQAGTSGSPFSAGVPALAVSNNTLAIAWNNSGAILYSFYDLVTQEWADPKVAGGTDGITFGIMGSPAIGFADNQLFMTWLGSGNDGIYYSAFYNERAQWLPQQQAEGIDGVIFGSLSSPAIAVSGSQIMMTWSGTGNDGTWFSIYQSFSLVNTWAAQQPAQRGVQFGANGTSTVTCQNNTIFMAWNGVGGEGVWTSQYDMNGGEWTGQQIAFDSNGKPFFIENSPGVTTCGNGFFMAWNKAGTDAIYYSSTNGLAIPASE